MTYLIVNYSWQSGTVDVWLLINISFIKIDCKRILCECHAKLFYVERKSSWYSVWKDFFKFQSKFNLYLFLPQFCVGMLSNAKAFV